MLPPMELRQLRYFVAVAEEGNISRAAQKIFLTQPALSRQIKALEDEVGQALLERRPHSIHLTHAGETMLTEARELLERARLLVERVQATGAGPCLRVGYAPSLAAGILSIAVERFTQLHPRAHVELSDLSTNEMLSGLESDKLDVVITVGPEKAGGGVRWTPLVRTSWQLAVSRLHPFAQKDRVTAAELAAEPLLVFAKRDYPEYSSAIMDWFRSHKLRPKIAGEHDGVESLMAAVEAGLGVALVTTRMGRLFPDRARLKTLASPPPPLCIAAGYRPKPTADTALEVFLKELQLAAKSSG